MYINFVFIEGFGLMNVMIIIEIIKFFIDIRPLRSCYEFKLNGVF